mmetsp:Transcript_11804/g.25442  ORF Transcript_11804/g.25442 Transcript_11804/m.25442 type:complete len:345 (-) Transcript_11804:252-1286(-)
MSSHFTPKYSSSALLYSPTSNVCSQPPKFLLPQMVTLHASQASSRLLHCSWVAGFSPLHFGPLQCTSLVRVPSPQCALHSPQSPILYKQPLWFSQGRLSAGFLAPPQSSSCPEEQYTVRTWIPSPHSVEQEFHVPVSHRASCFFALPSPFFSHPSGMGTGTASLPPRQSGGFSQTMRQSGLGQAVGFLQSHWQVGSGQTVLHPVSALAQSSTHLGLSQRVEHLGQPMTFVPFGQISVSGQNIAQLGSPQFTLQPWNAPLPSLGQRVSQAGTGHRGLQFCSQTGWVQFQAQWGTQLFRLSKGTIVDPMIAPSGAEELSHAAGSRCTAAVIAPCGSTHTLTPRTGL